MSDSFVVFDGDDDEAMTILAFCFAYFRVTFRSHKHTLAKGILIYLSYA